MKLRTKVFTYIFSFAMIIVLLLWTFQIVFLDDFYKMIKTRQIKNTANKIADVIGTDELASSLYSIVVNGDYCIRILQKDSDSLEGEIYVEPYAMELANNIACGAQEVGTISAKEAQLYQEASEHGGEAVATGSNSTTLPSGVEVKNNFERITVGKIVEVNNDKYFLLVNARISPVNETVDTLIQQLMIITVILLILALGLAFLIANNISKPIHKINGKAKTLASGKLDVRFDGKGYLEIEELNDTLNYAVEELSKAENLRNELIANMSHDLRTPLTMISGYSEAIRDLPGEDTKENIQVIIDECQRLTNLVNNILDLSKIQANTEKLVIETFNLSERLRIICDRFNTLLKKDAYELILVKDVEQDVYIQADQEKMTQVIYNIIGNAVHYTGTDKKVYVRQIVKDGRVRIEIEDTGKGIKEEDIPYVWDRYYKLKTNHKRQQLGSGLGLSIVRGILELHSVSYGIVSEKGKGAIFYFEFPIEKVE